MSWWFFTSRGLGFRELYTVVLIAEMSAPVSKSNTTSLSFNLHKPRI
ncbi:unnamed protein product, partial [Brachionus calyciflorus]